MSDAVLRVEDCARSFGETTALDGVSLEVAPGETVALVGPNGAGKTTFVRCCTGTLTPDRGTVSCFGDAPRGGDRSRVGLLPQAFDPPGRLTPRELVRYYAGLYDDALQVDEALDAVGLGGAAADTRYADCSGGERRRTCVACALVNEPDLLVLDEPTTGIDPAGRRAVWERLDDLTAGGTTILLTTHDMAEAERLADRIVVLAEGRVAASGTPAGIVRDHGGPPRIMVDLAGDGEAESEEAQRAVAGAVGEGCTVTATADGLRVDGAARADLGPVADALADAGCDATGIRWTDPTLEDAYLALIDGESTDDPTGTPEPAAAAAEAHT
jgi:ABC-2 type transport system ATP-binding protein